MFSFHSKGPIYLSPPKVAFESVHKTALPRRDPPWGCLSVEGDHVLSCSDQNRNVLQDLIQVIVEKAVHF